MTYHIYCWLSFAPISLRYITVNVENFKIVELSIDIGLSTNCIVAQINHQLMHCAFGVWITIFQVFDWSRHLIENRVSNWINGIFVRAKCTIYTEKTNLFSVAKLWPGNWHHYCSQMNREYIFIHFLLLCNFLFVVDICSKYYLSKKNKKMY